MQIPHSDRLLKTYYWPFCSYMSQFQVAFQSQKKKYLEQVK